MVKGKRVAYTIAEIPDFPEQVYVTRDDGKWGDKKLRILKKDWKRVQDIGWCIVDNGYLIGGVPENGKSETWTIHRYIFFKLWGETLDHPEHVVGHWGQYLEDGVTRDKFDVTCLKSVTRSHNGMDRVHNANKTGYRGVKKLASTYATFVGRDQEKKRHIARYESIIDAARHYNAWMRDHSSEKKVFNEGPEFEGNLFNPIGQNMYKPRELKTDRSHPDWVTGISETGDGRWNVSIYPIDPTTGKTAKERVVKYVNTIEKARDYAQELHLQNQLALKMYHSMVDAQEIPRNEQGQAIIQTSKGDQVFVSDGFWRFLTKSHATIILKNKYPYIKNTSLHLIRIKMLTEWESMPEYSADHIQVDHIDRNPHNCCDDNLDITFQSVNALNKDSQSIWQYRKKWYPNLTIFQKKLPMVGFDTAEEARSFVDNIKKRSRCVVVNVTSLKPGITHEEVINDLLRQKETFLKTLE